MIPGRILGDSLDALSGASFPDALAGSVYGWEALPTEENGLRLYDDREKTTLVAQYEGEPFWQDLPFGPGAPFVSEVTVSGDRPYPRVTQLPGVHQYDAIASDTSTQRNCWAFGAGLYVEVGEGGIIRTSPTGDAGSWTTQTSGTANALISVRWVSWLSLFVTTGASNTILTSPDGVTWTARIPSPISASWRGLADNGTDLLVTVGSGGNYASSTDGISWTSALAAGGTTSMWGVEWVPAHSLFFATNLSFSSVIIRYWDGSAPWQAPSIETSTTNGELYSVAFVGARVLVTGAAGRAHYSDTPTSAASWVKATTGTSETLHSMTANGYIYVFGSNGASRVSTDNGVTWNAGPAIGTTDFVRFGMADPNNATRALVVGDAGTLIAGSFPFRITPYPTEDDRENGTNPGTPVDVAYSAQPEEVVLTIP